MLDNRIHFCIAGLQKVEGVIAFKRIIEHLIQEGYDISIRPHPQEATRTYNVLRKK